MFAVAFSAVIVLLLAWYVFTSCDYPYYFIWDMDYVICLDTVLIQSGLLPDHICHPGSGMYLPLFFSEKIAHLFGALSALDLEGSAGLQNCLARYRAPSLSCRAWRLKNYCEISLDTITQKFFFVIRKI